MTIGIASIILFLMMPFIVVYLYISRHRTSKKVSKPKVSNPPKSVSPIDKNIIDFANDVWCKMHKKHYTKAPFNTHMGDESFLTQIKALHKYAKDNRII